MSSFAAAPDTYVYNPITEEYKVVVGWADAGPGYEEGTFLPIVAGPFSAYAMDYENGWELKLKWGLS
jgi:hypothetical protein